MGGGVRPVSSENVSQNSLPLELRIACCWKLLDRIEFMSAIISSSIADESCVFGPMLGEDGAGIWWWRGSRSVSLSRVCLTTSASRRNSVSIGALSSARAARILAKPLVLGYDTLTSHTSIQ